MRSPIVVPDLDWPGLVVSIWFVKPGESVYAGDRLVELLLGGATFEMTASCTGTLAERCAGPEDPVSPGQVVGYLEGD